MKVAGTGTPTASSPLPSAVEAIVLGQFIAEGPNELSVEKNDRVQIFYHANRKWAFVRRRHDGQTGYVPFLYCAALNRQAVVPSVETVVRKRVSGKTDDSNSFCSHVSISDGGLPSPSSSHSSYAESAGGTSGTSGISSSSQPPLVCSPISSPMQVNVASEESCMSSPEGSTISSSSQDIDIGVPSGFGSPLHRPSQHKTSSKSARNPGIVRQRKYIETELDSSFSSSDSEGVSSYGKGSEKRVTFSPDTTVFDVSTRSSRNDLDNCGNNSLPECHPYTTVVKEDDIVIEKYTLV